MELGIEEQRRRSQVSLSSTPRAPALPFPDSVSPSSQTLAPFTLSHRKDHHGQYTYKPSLWNSGERRSSHGRTPNPTFLGPHSLILRGRMVLTGGLSRAAGGVKLEKDPDQEDGMSSHKVWILIRCFYPRHVRKIGTPLQGHGQCLSLAHPGVGPAVHLHRRVGSHCAACERLARPPHPFQMEVTQYSQQGAQASTATIVALCFLWVVYFRIHFL